MLLRIHKYKFIHCDPEMDDYYEDPKDRVIIVMARLEAAKKRVRELTTELEAALRAAKTPPRQTRRVRVNEHGEQIDPAPESAPDPKPAVKPEPLEEEPYDYATMGSPQLDEPPPRAAAPVKQPRTESPQREGIFGMMSRT